MDQYPSWFAAVRDPNLWAFTIGDGWFPLLAELCEGIAAANPPASFQFTTIKQKYGLLRIYCCNGNNGIEKLLDQYEERSKTICQNCGATGNLAREANGYVVTLCTKCRNPLPDLIVAEE
jgi:hypothetical protein